MVTLYTAIGTYKLNSNGKPTIVAGNKEYGMVAYELLLWSYLSFRILTYQELKKEFYEKEREMCMLGELEFDHYLNRLVMRGLVVSGKDETGADALYDLLGHLHVQAVPDSWFVKAATFLKLALRMRMPLSKAVGVFETAELEPMERQLLSLVKKQTLSTAELIRCTEQGISSLGNKDELIELLYAEADSDCDKMVYESRFSELRYRVLSAVANLYLKQRVMFHLV